MCTVPACIGCKQESRGGRHAAPCQGRLFDLLLPGWLGKNLTAIFYAPFSSRTTFLNTPCTVAFFSNTHRAARKEFLKL